MHDATSRGLGPNTSHNDGRRRIMEFDDLMDDLDVEAILNCHHPMVGEEER